MTAILNFRTFMGQILIDFSVVIHYIKQGGKPLILIVWGLECFYMYLPVYGERQVI